ncbi:putative reverse transcriptase domain-containing protein [Tanacetum coccineum]
MGTSVAGVLGGYCNIPYFQVLGYEDWRGAVADINEDGFYGSVRFTALPVVRSPYRLPPSGNVRIVKPALRTSREGFIRTMFTHHGEHPSSKIEFWSKNWKILSHPTGIRQFLGLAGYYRRFIENFSKIAKPLTLLTQKNKTYVWGNEQDEAFRILKEKLCNAPVLALPDGPDDFVVYCDASKQGFGCVLMQRGKVETTEHQKPSGFLQQPEIPEWKWEKLTMYFITKLPKSSSGHVMVQFHVIRMDKELLHEALGTRLDMSMLTTTQTNGQIPSEHYVCTIRGYIRAEMVDPPVIYGLKLEKVRSRQKSYADKRHKPLEFKVGDRVLLKVSPWKGVVRFGKKGKLAPRCVYDTFHVSNLKKCLAEPDVQVPLDEIEIDENLRFFEELWML